MTPDATPHRPCDSCAMLEVPHQWWEIPPPGAFAQAGEWIGHAEVPETVWGPGERCVECPRRCVSL